MEEENIKRIIADYNVLLAHTEEVINKIKKLDKKYSTSRGIETISFDLQYNTVDVVCDDSCMGCHDQISFDFPIPYLSMNDVELEKTVIGERLKFEEIERLKKEKEIENDKLRKLALFNKLKDELKL